MTCFDFPAAIAAHAMARPDHLAVICGDGQIGYADFARRADAVAATLAKLGTAAGDAVAIIAASSVDYAVM